MNEERQNLPTVQRNAEGAMPRPAPVVKEIDLLELAAVLMDQLHYIVFFFLLGAVLLNAYAYFFIHPTYESTASIYIVNASSGTVVDLTDLNIGSSLKNDYKEFIMSYPVLDRVSSRLKLGWSTEKMKKAIRVSNPTDTRILMLTATAETPELAMDIANTLTNVAVQYLPETMSTEAPNIAQRARLPEHKANPSYAKYTAMGGLLGALLCCAWFTAKHLMYDMIRTAEDLERCVGDAPLTTIPFVDLLAKGEMRSDASANAPNDSAAQPPAEGTAAEEAAAPDRSGAGMGRIDLTIPELPYAAEEALNRLRVNVKFSGKDIKTILVISSVPNEGKSHVSVYLWKMLAEVGFRTVLVDCDLRKSVMKDELMFRCEVPYQGLDYYLSGLAEYQDIVHATNVENGDIVPCTNLLQNPSSLLEDPRLRDLFSRLEEDYDYVIVDSPPLVSVSDGILIAQCCDGALLVVRSGETPRALVKQSLAQLERANCRLFGTVLNGVHTSSRAYGYGYGYGKYYGDYYGKSGKR